MGISNIVDFLMGLSWSFLGPSFAILAWRLSNNAFPIERKAGFYSRVIFTILCGFLYLLFFGCVSDLLSGYFPSDYSRQFFSLGVLAGLIAYAFSIKGNATFK